MRIVRGIRGLPNRVDGLHRSRYSLEPWWDWAETFLKAGRFSVGWQIPSACDRSDGDQSADDPGHRSGNSAPIAVAMALRYSVRNGAVAPRSGTSQACLTFPPSSWAPLVLTNARL